MCELIVVAQQHGHLVGDGTDQCPWSVASEDYESLLVLPTPAYNAGGAVRLYLIRTSTDHTVSVLTVLR